MNEPGPDRMGNVKSIGNTAKLYCLQKLGELAARGAPLVVLDLGCGAGRNFPQFLDAYPNVRYVGADPHEPSLNEARKVLAGKNAELQFAAGDGFVLEGGADVIVSFSVFEHVPIARRRAYLQAVRANLRPGGIALINYDAGHFTTETTTRQHHTAWLALRQAVTQFVRNQLVERFGAGVYYQRFVPEASFVEYCADAGLRILETKSFNTGLKRVLRSVKPEAREEFMRRWLDLELWLDANTVRYDDALAAVFTTRCHVLGLKNAS